MGREKGVIWKAVGPEGSDGKSNCAFCKFRYKATASSIRMHLTGGSNEIRYCDGLKYQELPSDIATAISETQASQRKKRSRDENGKSFANLFGTGAKDAADTAIAELVYGCGLPFNVARSDFFKRAVQAINKAPRGYEGPCFERLRTDLLARVKERCKDAVQPCYSYKRLEDTGGTLCSDGWGNISRQHLINVMLSCPEGTVFHSAVECTGDVKSGEFIAELLIKAIEEIGSGNIVQVCFTIVYQSCPCIQCACCFTLCGVHSAVLYSPSFSLGIGPLPGLITCNVVGHS